MKIAFISGVRFGYELLSYLLENNYKISIVFSYDDSKKTSYSDFASFDDLTKKNNITHVKVKNINDEQNVELLRSIAPDVILVMGWSQILKKEILEIPRLGVVGSHPTELPKFRGRAPIPWTIIRGLKESALTFFYMKEGVDDGDILDQRNFKISMYDDASSLYEKIIFLGKQMILENINLLEKGMAKRIIQDESKFIEYWPKRTPEDGKIDWSTSAKDIHTLIRATTHPYPGAFTFFKKSKLKIWTAKYYEDKNDRPGRICEINPEGVTVGTAKGTVLIQSVSLNEQSEVSSTTIFTKDDIGLVLE